jgi:hypothetical protein
MSLINDALRRASQTEKDRPRQASTPTGMEPTPPVRNSRLSVVLIAVVLVALVLAGWFFWRWWNARNAANDAAMTAVAPPVMARVLPPAAVPKPAPVAPVEPATPAPAPAVVAHETPVVAPPPATPARLPDVASYSPTPWPVDLKLRGIFLSKTNSQALINGNLYSVGDDIQGVTVKKIEKDRVTVEYDKRSRVLIMGGP